MPGGGVTTVSAPRSETRPQTNGRGPWSEEAELAALGCLFLGEEETARRVVELIPSDALHDAGHRLILRAARRVLERGETLDAVAVSDELRAAGQLDRVGGMPRLARLVDAAPGSTGLDSWASTIRRKAYAREARRALEEERKALATAAASEVPAIVERVERRLEDLREAHLPQDAEAKDDGIATAEEILADEDAAEEWEPVVDRIAWRSRLVMLAGREKLGKSTLLAEGAAAVTRGRTTWGRS